MKIVFFVHHNAINFNHIGGLDSVVRRLTTGLAEMGDSVNIVHYDAGFNECYRITDRIVAWLRDRGYVR